MKNAIDVAWTINLKLPIEVQYKSKEEIIKETCPHDDDYKIKLKGCTNEDGSVMCSKFGDNSDGLKCTRCWKSEIEEDMQEELNIYGKPTFDRLYKHPSLDIELNWGSEEYFINGLNKNKESLICIDEEELYTYGNIPKVIEYLQEVYDYCTELKNNMIEYVDFNTAKEYMLKGNKAKFENETYYIKKDELYCEDLKSACALKLRAIESNQWILL